MNIFKTLKVKTNAAEVLRCEEEDHLRVKDFQFEIGILNSSIYVICK